MHRIMFVCHGNICRSPMAEFVMKDLVGKRGVSDRFVIESAATSTEEIGNPVHPGTRRILAANNVDCAGKTARQITAEDYRSFDLLIGMDESNVRAMHRRFSGDQGGKVFKLLSFAGSQRDIADPWYTGDFEQTYRDVVAGCSGLLDALLDSSAGADN